MSIKNSSSYLYCPACSKDIENGPDHIYYSGDGYSQIIINRYKFCKMKKLPIVLDYTNSKDTLCLTIPDRKAPDPPLEKSLPSNKLFIMNKVFK